MGVEKVIYEAHKKYHIARCHDDKSQLLVGSVHLLPGDIMNGTEVVFLGFFCAELPGGHIIMESGDAKEGEMSDKNMRYCNRKSLCHFPLVYYLT